MKTRTDDRRTRSSGPPPSRGRGLVRARGRPRGSTAASPAAGGRGRAAALASPGSPSRGAPIRGVSPRGSPTRGASRSIVVRGASSRGAAPSRGASPRGFPVRRDVVVPVEAAARGRMPGRGRPRGRGRGRARGRGVVAAVSEPDDEDEDEDGDEPAPMIIKAVDSSASAESSTEDGDESGDDNLILIDSGRGSRKRQLPARFRDAPLQPLVRRRTASTSGDRPPGSPEKPAEKMSSPGAAAQRGGRSPLAARAGAPRSPLKTEKSPIRSPVRSPPTIAEKLERQAAEEEAARAAAAAEQQASTVKSEAQLVTDLLTDAIELDHGIGMGRAPPAGASPPRRKRVQSRSSEPGDQLPGGQLLAGEPLVEGEVLVEQQMLDEDDLITMELDPMDVPLPVETVPRRPCKICHRQTKVTNMKQHMLTHTGMRPFKCEICSAAFTRRSDVFRHVKILHQQEKPFKCSRDGKEFSDRKSLKQHMELHKRPALFACKVCDFRFGKFEYYVNHVKFIHPTGEPLPAFPEDVEPEPEPVAPPRGRYGPTPLQAYMDDDDDDSPAGLEHGMGEELQLAGGLENIETEEIPHDSMHLVASGAADEAAAAAAAGAQAVTLQETAVPDAVEGQDVVIGSAAPAAEDGPGARREMAGPKDDAPEQINFPPLEEDAAAILGMTDLALTNENTSLQSVGGAASLEAPLEPPASAPVVVLSGAGQPVRRHVDPLISTRTVAPSQPRVVTIGKPVTGSNKTVLLTRPRMVAGKQVLQAVKLGPGQKIVAARVPGGRGGGAVGRGGQRQPIVRQVLINRPGGGGAARVAPKVVTSTRVVRPAVRPVSGVTRTLGASGSVKTVSPAIRVVRPAAPPARAPEPKPAPPPPPEPAPAADDTKNIEVTTSTASGSRTIILQTSGGGGDILQSEEAMQTLLEAVQQLVSASGDTLEGKQIEIVMQNEQQGAAAPAPAAGGPTTVMVTPGADAPSPR